MVVHQQVVVHDDEGHSLAQALEYGARASVRQHQSGARDAWQDRVAEGERRVARRGAVNDAEVWVVRASTELHHDLVEALACQLGATRGTVDLADQRIELGAADRNEHDPRRRHM